VNLPRAPMRITPAFGFSFVNRAIQEGFGRRKFGKAEMAQIVSFFGDDPPRCVFCGAQPIGRWDHLIPVKCWGETVLGNMVPSCAHCDDSKQQYRYEEWMRSNPGTSAPGVEERIARIQAYVKHFGYAPRLLDDRLNPGETKRLKAIQDQLARAQTDLEQLIKDYKARTGEG